MMMALIDGNLQKCVVGGRQEAEQLAVAVAGSS